MNVLTKWLNTRGRFSALIVIAGLSLVSQSKADNASAVYSPAAASDVPRQVFWGDTHLHTRLSSDAFSANGYTLGPEEAYRFARGETIQVWNGMPVKLKRPLDFLVIADHAQYLGIFEGIRQGDEALLNTEAGSRWRKYLDAGDIRRVKGEFIKIIMGWEGETPEARIEFPEQVRQSIWQAVGERADRYNEPGRFTALIGYEYSATPQLSNLHRNVIFRDDASVTSRQLPFTAGDSLNPEDLWRALEKYETQTGGAVLAIPHNGNTSNGKMFDTVTYRGEPLTRDYARQRSRWEPLFEVTQFKGDSEAHPVLSPNDEFADFETWNTWFGPSHEGAETEEWKMQKRAEYTRSALKQGLKFQAQLGANPFKFGMIGSTDSHTGLATAEEDNFWGKFSEPGIPSRDRWKNSFSVKDVADEASQQSWILAASGLAAVWAPENTRAALFDAMKRREVYATTGSRITVRFFGGWHYPDDADVRPDYVDIGYRGGVPMGADLTAAPQGKSPRFIVVAVKDPDEANLDRIQIVKGWRDSSHQLHEKVYDVAWSDGRQPDRQSGRLPAVGSTVNTQAASYTNSIGEAVLSTVWQDPAFNAEEEAFYYARVLEIPKPRWTAVDAAFFDAELPEEIPAIIQDRAYTSPIWYTP